MAVVKKAAQTIGKKVVPAIKKGAKKVVDTVQNVQPEIPGIGGGKTANNTAKTTVKNVKPLVKKSTEKVGNMSKKVLDKAVPAAGVAGAGVGLAQKVGQSGVGKFAKNVVKGGKDIAKSAISKLKSGVKKVVSNPTVQKVAKTAVKAVPGLALAGGLAVGAKKLADRGKKIEQDKKNAAIEKQVDDYVEKRKNPGGINKVDGKQFDSRGQKPIETETKPKKMHSIEKKNRARFGDEAVDKKKAMNVDFKKMRSKEMSKADFIKKYPNSITAQREAGLRDHTEWDAYDMVLEYLFSTEQVTSLEEANYVMMEMEQQTIGEIVKEVKVALEEEVDAPDMKYVMSHGMSDQTFANTAKKTFSGKSKKGKDGYSDQNKFTAELMRRQSNTGKDFSGNPLYKKKEEKK